MKKVTLRFTWQLILTIVIAFFIGSLPYLIFDMRGLLMVQQMIDTGQLSNAMYLGFDPHIRFDLFFGHLSTAFTNLFHLPTMTYYAHGEYKNLYPLFFDKYLYSIRILITSLGIAFCLSIILTLCVMVSPPFVKRFIKTAIQAIQTIPDIFYLIFFQVIAVILYVNTHILLFEVAQYEQQIYALPIIILTILPTLQMTQILILNFEDELNEPYVEFAESKGLRKLRVLVIHIFRNALVSFLANVKTIFWFTLSNLIMVEILLNMNGFIHFLFEFGPLTPDIVTYGLIMMVLPFLIIFFIAQQIVNKMNHGTDSEVL